jgi:FG-GAP repeat
MVLRFVVGGLICACCRGQGYPVHSWAGNNAGQTLGWSAAIIGDVNSDGSAEVVIGSPGATWNGNPNAGVAQVFDGATGNLLYTLGGGSCCMMIGHAVAAAGDVDADGVPDFLIGAPAASSTGAVLVKSGATFLTLHFLGGTGTQQEFGHSVAAAGDVNGDGRGDVIVGARLADPGFPNAGEVKVFSGLTGGVLHTFTGTGGFDTLGDAVASAGDVDGDNVPDIIAGATQPGFMAQYPNGPGYARVWSGATGALLGTAVGSTGAVNFGAAVAGAGDVDLDGFDDVIIGAPDAQLAAGQVVIHSGAAGAVVRTLNGAPPNDHLGAAIATFGDFDLDGYPDHLIGAPGVGGGAGAARIYSGQSGAVLASFSHPVAGANFGFAVSAGGDVNGDGVTDVLVALPFSSPGGLLAAGEVRVLSLAGIPAGSSSFGTGCASATTGQVPRIATYGGVPASTGNPGFGILGSKLLPGSTSVLIAGASSASWLGTPLPLGLGQFGMPSCSLFVSADLLFTLPVSADGRAILPAPVPASPPLAGLVAYLQWYVVDPGPAPAPGVLSGALNLVIQ